MVYWKVSAKDKFWPVAGRIMVGTFVIFIVAGLVTAVAMPFLHGGLRFGLAFWGSVGLFVGVAYLVGSYVVWRA